jgi:hypothetical protein
MEKEAWEDLRNDGLCFIIPVSDVNGPSIVKDDDGDEEEIHVGELSRQGNIRNTGSCGCTFHLVDK